jgi:hypothetical protein
MNERSLERIYTAKSAGECDVVRMALAGEGIATFVAQPNLSALMGRFELLIMVDADDAERAKSCIDDHRSSPVSAEELEAGTPDSPSAEEESEKSEQRGFSLLRWVRLALLRPHRRRQWWERFVQIRR